MCWPPVESPKCAEYLLLVNVANVAIVPCVNSVNSFVDSYLLRAAACHTAHTLRRSASASARYVPDTVGN